MKNVIEKRIFPRRAYRTKVVFDDEFGEGLFYVYSTDISMGGLFLESDIPVKLGTMLFLSFIIPGHKRPVRATGEVVRKTGILDGVSTGMGVRFVGISELTRARLEEFLGGYS